MDKIKRKILVVDDEITVCKSIRQAILSEGYEVDMALSGEEALKQDAKKAYDLIITDLMMPGISGIDLLRSLKLARPKAAVIMVTGYPTIKTAVQSVKMGAFDYLPKPFTPAELRGLVSRALKKAESEARGVEEVEEILMPSGLYYMLGHAWLRLEDGKRGTIGVVFDFLKAVGKIVSVELPKVHDTLNQGEVCGKINDAEKFIHRIWSPAAGMIIEVNFMVAREPSLLRQDPYGQGWLFKIEPANLEEDLKGLILSK